MPDVQESNAKLEGEMSNAVRWLVGIGCLSGLAVSIVILSQLMGLLAGQIMDQPSLIVTPGFFLFICPVGYLLVGWACVGHWRTVSRQDAMLVGTVALVGTLLTLGAFPPPEMWSREAKVLMVGFWMLNGLGLAWLLRKLRRIKRKANAE